MVWAQLSIEQNAFIGPLELRKIDSERRKVNVGPEIDRLLMISGAGAARAVSVGAHAARVRVS